MFNPRSPLAVVHLDFRTTMGVQHRPVAGASPAVNVCVSSFLSGAAIETSKAGKREDKTCESTNTKRTHPRTRTATVPVVRGTGTGEGWPPGIPKPSKLKGHEPRPASPAISDRTLLDMEAGGDKRLRQQSAPGKEGVPAAKVKKENR